MTYQNTMGTELNFRDSWKFDLAGYKLDRLRGRKDKVPVSVERKDKGSAACFTCWVDDVLMLVDKQWQIWMIDHSRAFRISHEVREPKNFTRCDRALLEKMKELTCSSGGGGGWASRSSGTGVSRSGGGRRR